VYRYHKKYISPRADFIKLVFKKFEILDLSLGNGPIGFVEICKKLTDRELLRTIMDYVKGKTKKIIIRLNLEFLVLF
jgi:hypothetical protein